MIKGVEIDLAVFRLGPSANLLLCSNLNQLLDAATLAPGITGYMTRVAPADARVIPGTLVFGLSTRPSVCVLRGTAASVLQLGSRRVGKSAV